MYRVRVQSTNPKNLSNELKKQIVTLHKKYFQLSADEIIKYLMVRDYVDLYFDRQNGELIGTVGIQWYKFDNAVIMYLGNAVVNKSYQRFGLLTKSINKAIRKTILRYPRHHKYNMALATSPKAYNFYGKLKYAWPKPYEPTPENIQKLMLSFLRTQYQDSYKVCTDFYVITPDDAALKSVSTHKMPQRFTDLWFTLANPAYQRGEQLLCLAQLNVPTILTMLKAGLPLYRLKSVAKNCKSRLRKFFDKKDLVYLSLLSCMGLVWALAE